MRQLVANGPRKLGSRPVQSLPSNCCGWTQLHPRGKIPHNSSKVSKFAHSPIAASPRSPHFPQFPRSEAQFLAKIPSNRRQSCLIVQLNVDIIHWFKWGNVLILSPPLSDNREPTAYETIKTGVNDSYALFAQPTNREPPNSCKTRTCTYAVFYYEPWNRTITPD